jgi:hypothetical protein
MLTEPYSNGLLFSVKQPDSFISNLAWLTCYAWQRAKPHYTHVSVLYDHFVYETSLTYGVQKTRFDHGDANDVNVVPYYYSVFMPLPELNAPHIDDVSSVLDYITDNAGHVCTTLVSDILYEFNVVTPRVCTPDQMYVALTLTDG